MPGSPASVCVRYGSSIFAPFTYTVPPLADTVSPGNPITRLMKSSFVGLLHAETLEQPVEEAAHHAAVGLALGVGILEHDDVAAARSRGSSTGP